MVNFSRLNAFKNGANFMSHGKQSGYFEIIVVALQHSG